MSIDRAMLLLSGFACILWMLTAPRTLAQDAVTTTPNQLTIAGQRGETITRILVLRASDPLSNIQVIPLDLQRAGDGITLSADIIRADLPAVPELQNGVLNIPIVFDLQGVASGEFRGELLISYVEGVLTVPVTIRVKDGWQIPLLVLIMGIVAGVSISTYRVRGRPRDELLVRIGKLRAQMRADSEVVPSFRIRIEYALVDVESALQAETWSEALQSMQEAEAIWEKWRKGRDDWTLQLAYCNQLLQRIRREKSASSSAYAQALVRNLQDASRSAPDLHSPQELRERLDTLKQQFEHCLILQMHLNQAKALHKYLTDPLQKQTWGRILQDLEQRAHSLEPASTEAYQQLVRELESAKSKLSTLVDQQQAPILGTEALEADSAMTEPEPLPPQPATSPDTLPQRPALEERIRNATTRLWWFAMVSYVVVVALLAMAGYSELYAANPTFGATPASDYATLLAWGFGAETSRAAIVELGRTWQLPGLRR